MFYAKSAASKLWSYTGGWIPYYWSADAGKVSSEHGPDGQLRFTMGTGGLGTLGGGRLGLKETIFDVILSNDTRKLQDMIRLGFPLSGVYNESGLTPLMCAAELGRDRLVRLLLTGGARVNERDNFADPDIGTIGNTALHWAVSEGWPTTTQLLLEAGAEVNSQNSVGWTPLHLCIIGDAPNPERRMGTAQALIAAGANVNIADRNGHLPADLALLTGRAEIMRLLLNGGTQLCRLQPLGPLYAILAKSEECIACVKLAMRAGAYSVQDLAAFVDFAYRVMGAAAAKYNVMEDEDEEGDGEDEENLDVDDLLAQRAEDQLAIMGLDGEELPPSDSNRQDVDDEIERVARGAGQYLDVKDVEAGAGGEFRTPSANTPGYMTPRLTPGDIPAPTNQILEAKQRGGKGRSKQYEKHGSEDYEEPERNEWVAEMDPYDQLEAGTGTGIWTSPHSLPYSINDEATAAGDGSGRARPPLRPTSSIERGVGVPSNNNEVGTKRKIRQTIYVLDPEALPAEIDGAGPRRQDDPEAGGEPAPEPLIYPPPGEEELDDDWDPDRRIRYGEYPKDLLDELGITLVMYTKCKTLKMWSRYTIRRHLDGRNIGSIINSLHIPLEFKNYILLENGDEDEE